MMNKKPAKPMMVKASGAKSMKFCAGCKSPSQCKTAGKCMGTGSQQTLRSKY
jgi:hypothetical protein